MILFDNFENYIKEGDAEVAKSSEDITKKLFEKEKEETNLDSLTDENIADQDDPQLSANVFFFCNFN